MVKKLHRYELIEIARAAGLTGEVDNVLKFDNPYGPQVFPLGGLNPFLTRVEFSSIFTIKGSIPQDTVLVEKEESEISTFHKGLIRVQHPIEWEVHIPHFRKDRLRRMLPQRPSEYRYYKKEFDVGDSTFIITTKLGETERIFLNHRHTNFNLDTVLACLGEYRKTKIRWDYHFSYTNKAK